MLVAALATTVARHPSLNAMWAPDGIVVASGVHVGVAADTERGLVVPVLRDAQASGIAALRDRDPPNSPRAPAPARSPRTNSEARRSR